MGTVGDCWDRYWVRMAEMKQSCRIIRQALGETAGRTRAKSKGAPGGETTSGRGVLWGRESTRRAGILHCFDG